MGFWYLLLLDEVMESQIRGRLHVAHVTRVRFQNLFSAS